MQKAYENLQRLKEAVDHDRSDLYINYSLFQNFKKKLKFSRVAKW